MSLTSQNLIGLPSDLNEHPVMSSRTKTSRLRPVTLPREAPRAAPRSWSTNSKTDTKTVPKTNTKTVPKTNTKTDTKQSPDTPRTFASIAASAAHLPDPGATEKKISLISRPLKERKKKTQDDYDIDPQDEWYASSSSDDECCLTDDDDEDYHPPGDNDEEMWQ